MNLAVLERMVGQGDLSTQAFQYLLNCRGEVEWLDYKQSLQLDNDHQLCDFAKDVLAFKNVGGGYIVVGVKDKTWDQIGLTSPFPYETKLLRDKIVRATGLTLDVDVVTHSLMDAAGEKRFALIFVRSSRKRTKRRSPTMIAKDFCAGKPYGLRRGEIYMRDGDSTIKVSTQEQLTNLLDRLEDQTDEDALRSEGTVSLFAIEDGTYRLLDKGFGGFVGRISHREKLLAAIRGDPRIWIINVHGPGGVGKSALVNWATYELYAARHFEAILHLTAKETILTDEGIMRNSRSLYSLENLLDHILSLFEETTQKDLVSKQALAYELLCAWKTLLVLDNMETVSDARVLSFIQGLPLGSKSRVVLTSREKTGGWELALPVTEMTPPEMLEFVQLTSRDLNIVFPTDEQTICDVTTVSGGLPLAAQWIVGRYKNTGRLDLALEGVKSKDSPVLEFSFRNIWSTLEADSRIILALLSIFDGPATVQEIVVASEMTVEVVERALSRLIDVTLVNRTTQQSDGRTFLTALPITLSFARNQLETMGELEIQARQRVQRFNEQMELQVSEVARFQGEFDKYDLSTPNEKRAAILCRRAESEMFSGNADTAELMFQQARTLAPQSAYVHAKSAAYELARNRVGAALERIREACSRANAKTGALCYTVKARILDVQWDKQGRLEALEKALSYDRDDAVLRHQYGVALSRVGCTQEAIREFTKIIESESMRVPVRETLIMALTTRIINFKRLGQVADAIDDAQTARELIARHPHLAHSAVRLSEVEAELVSSRSDG
jgi:tetratricopeptide (TPR) repeat protein